MEGNKQFFVYYLYSASRNCYYLGQTDSIDFRLWEHNTGQEKFTNQGAPWKLVGYIICSSRSEAIRLETRLKGAKNKKYVAWYIKQNGTLMEC